VPVTRGSDADKPADLPAVASSAPKDAPNPASSSGAVPSTPKPATIQAPALTAPKVERAPLASQPSAEPAFQYAAQLQILQGMGFGDEALNRYLLLNGKGDLQAAVDHLLQRQ